jgi:hypothetical protein
VQFFSSDEDEKRQVTVQDDWSGTSGSRWEPVPEAGTAGTARDEPEIEPVTRRRRVRPVVAVLVTLLGAGAVTGGAAYAQRDATPTGAPASQVATGDEHAGRHGPGVEGADGGHRRGPRTGDEQAAPSGASS